MISHICWKYFNICKYLHPFRNIKQWRYNRKNMSKHSAFDVAAAPPPSSHLLRQFTLYLTSLFLFSLFFSTEQHNINAFSMSIKAENLVFYSNHVGALISPHVWFYCFYIIWRRENIYRSQLVIRHGIIFFFIAMNWFSIKTPFVVVMSCLMNHEWMERNI